MIVSPRVGQRVSVAPHDDAELLGIVTELDRYEDGTPAAWVQYDDMRQGLTVKLPLSELRPILPSGARP